MLITNLKIVFISLNNLCVRFQLIANLVAINIDAVSIYDSFEVNCIAIIPLTVSRNDVLSEKEEYSVCLITVILYSL